jgi:hypothetical protein
VTVVTPASSPFVSLHRDPHQLVFEVPDQIFQAEVYVPGDPDPYVSLTFVDPWEAAHDAVSHCLDCRDDWIGGAA